MMQSLLRTTIDDDMRNHGCEFPPERKLQLMEQLAQTKRPSNFGPSRRTHAKRRSSTIPSARSRSTMSFNRNTHRLPSLDSRGSVTPHPMMQSQHQRGCTPKQRTSEMAFDSRNKHPVIPEHTRKFFNNCPQLHPREIAKIHKNLQEKLYVKFKSTRDAFRAFDVDFSGDIDPIEFKNALRRMEVITQRDELTVDALFNLCNESGSGSISYQEFAKWIKVPDRHENLMVFREDPYKGNLGGMTFGSRSNVIRALGVMCE